MNLIFDLDGTLYKSEELYLARDVEIFKMISLKLDISLDEARALLFSKKKELKELGEPSNTLSTLKKLGISSNEFFESLEKVSPRLFIKKDEKLTQLFSDLSKNHSIYIFTNSTFHSSKEIVTILGISLYVKEIFSAETIGFAKPSVDAFSYVLNRVNVSDERNVMVGDSIEKDLKTAKALGMQTIALSLKQENYPYVDYFISDLNELLKIVN